MPCYEAHEKLYTQNESQNLTNRKQPDFKFFRQLLAKCLTRVTMGKSNNPIDAQQLEKSGPFCISITAIDAPISPNLRRNT